MSGLLMNRKENKETLLWKFETQKAKVNSTTVSLPQQPNFPFHSCFPKERANALFPVIEIKAIILQYF